MDKNRAFCGAVLALLLIAPIGSSLAASPRAEILELEDKDRALVAKETIKQRQVPGNKAKSTSAGTDKSCGSVDIGNDDGTKKGTSRVAERQKTVIVTGNVYNTANCKR